MKKIFLALAAAALAVLSCDRAAYAASASTTFTINSSASVSVLLNPLVNFITTVAPVAPGTALYAIIVAPSTWTGTLALSGPDAAKFAITGTNIVVGASPLAAGTYNVTVTATP